MQSGIKTFLVTLALTISMVSGAVVHGMALVTPPRSQAVLHEVVICASDAAEAVIMIDAQGNRVDPADEPCTLMPCPDCLAAVTFALAAAHSTLIRSDTAIGTVVLPSFPFLPEPPFAHEAARGPPHEV